MASVEIRWYAGAGAAAGTPSSVLDLPGGTSVAEALAEAVGENSALAAVVEASSLLEDGVRVNDRTAPLTGARLDVLPPFAGG